MMKTLVLSGNHVDNLIVDNVWNQYELRTLHPRNLLASMKAYNTIR